jgi:uncharacterized protein YodC (DUF2158 family)
MATKFKKGDVVTIKAVIPNGPVLALRMDEDGVVYCLIEWVDENGQTQQRWFAEDNLTGA